jgi:hypothetical protein
MDWQPGAAHGAGEEPGREPALPDPDSGTGAAHDAPRSAAPPADRDRRLAGFARDGEWDRCSPSAELGEVVEAVSGPEWRCPGATSDELTGVLRRWAALEARAAAGRLGVIREMIRREGPRSPGGGWHGDLPDAWPEFLSQELAAALGVSAQSADAATQLAWDLQARLPGIGAKLADGTLSYVKAMLVSKELSVLSDGDAAIAEAMVLDQLAQNPYLTPGQLGRLAAQAAVTADPAGAERRRQAAEELDVRVQLWREQSGASALAGRNLPTDEALAAYASVNVRAALYKKSKAFPGASMDQFRAMAYLDLLNGTAAADRITSATAKADADAKAAAETTAGPAVGPPPPPGTPAPSRQGRDGPGEEGPGDPGTEAAEPGDPAAPPRLTDLVIPLRTLLGLAERSGEGHALGPLDPALCRDLAVAAASSPRSRWCLTVTDANGFAIGHGCARLGAGDKATWQAWLRQAASQSGTRNAGLAALPSQVNLTIPASALRDLADPAMRASAGPGPAAQPGTWGFSQRDGPAMPEDFGTWTLTLPGGRKLTVRIEPVPTYECDHRHESRAYHPGDVLRHLVQIRDGTCTFPPCSRHARDTDFEHAVPYDKGGRTCSCNAGSRSRKCHRTKQAPGWEVTQPRPGWHQWKTPSGRVYTQGPYRYPA